MRCVYLKKIFLVRRKGFNYYTDYIELYLHNSFESKGFYLIKEESKCIFNVIVDISEKEKYMTMISPYFDSLSIDEANDFAECLSINFKSEVIVMPYNGRYEFKGSPHKVMFSDIYNAFNEEPFVRNGKPELIRERFSLCKNQHPYVAEFINYGGAFKGITMTVTFVSDKVELLDTTINYYAGKNGKEKITKDISFQKVKNKFVCRLADFEMYEGFNKYSAVLRCKKREDEKTKHSFYIRFIPVIEESEYEQPEFEIDPWI